MIHYSRVHFSSPIPLFGVQLMGEATAVESKIAITRESEASNTLRLTRGADVLEIPWSHVRQARVTVAPKAASK